MSNVSRTDALTRLKTIQLIKQRGNKEYARCERSDYAKSAVTYGELIQEMMDFEKVYDWQQWDSEKVREIFDREQLESFEALKPVAFLNLAAANLKLQSYEGCRRCCNAALIFINKPTLKLVDMGAEDEEGDVTKDVELLEPVRLDLCALAAKALYRRSYSIYSMLFQTSGQRQSSTQFGSAATRMKTALLTALDGVNLALRIIPQDKTAGELGVATGLHKDLLALKQTLLNEGQDPSSSDMPDDAPSETRALNTVASLNTVAERECMAVLDTYILEGLQVNGGQCARRQGFWTQTIDTCTVYLPLQLLCNPESASHPILRNMDTKLKSKQELLVPLPISFQASHLEVVLGKAEVQVSYNGETVLHSVLEYNIYAPSKGKSANTGKGDGLSSSCSTWTLESVYSERRAAASGKVLTGGEDPPSHLVLHLQKIPSLEWYPGCEWWDRVFVDDEAIDTTTCKVDAGSVQLLPTEALQRAAQEHRRFTDQTPERQQVELADLARMKKTVAEAVAQHEQEQERGLRTEPEREEMLNALNTEFPHIFFGTK